jgi:hypothetical protein
LPLWVLRKCRSILIPRPNAAPPNYHFYGETAICCDGTHSFSIHRSGTCSDGIGKLIEERRQKALKEIAGKEEYDALPAGAPFYWEEPADPSQRILLHKGEPQKPQ